MRKRKCSDGDQVEDFSKVEEKEHVSLRHAGHVKLRVVKISNIVWLCLGILLGTIGGGPWIKKVEEIVLGYRWNAMDRCIMETPDEGYGVDFCRIPSTCDMCRDVSRIEEVHVSDLTWQHFYEDYAETGRPLVIRNATLDWPAMSLLNFEWIREAYLSDPDSLSYEDDKCWYNNYKSKHLHSLRALFRMPPEQVDDISQPWYVGWAVCQPSVADKIHALYHRPDFLHPDSTPPKKPWIFIGTPGPGAHIHIDNVDLSSWQAQISGTKTWLLRPPPECWWQCHGDMETTIYPGDIIVVNTNIWFHSTKIHGSDLSVVITNEFD